MTNKETIDVISQIINGGQQVILTKARQAGKSNINASLMSWYHLHSKYERARLRKETIKRLFNI